MLIFTWIVLGLAGLLLAFSGVCWGIFITNEDSDWRRLAVKVFRQSMMLLLLFINVFVYARLFGGMADS